MRAIGFDSARRPSVRVRATTPSETLAPRQGTRDVSASHHRHRKSAERNAVASYASTANTSHGACTTTGARSTRQFCEVPRRRAQRRRKNDGLVTHAECARTPIPDAPLPPPSQETRLRTSGVKPLSFAYFSLRQAKKSRCPPHRGNANKPIRKQGKANAVGTQNNTNIKGKKTKISIVDLSTEIVRKPVDILRTSHASD